MINIDHSYEQVGNHAYMNDHCSFMHDQPPVHSYDQFWSCMNLLIVASYRDPYSLITYCYDGKIPFEMRLPSFKFWKFGRWKVLLQGWTFFYILFPGNYCRLANFFEETLSDTIWRGSTSLEEVSAHSLAAMLSTSQQPFWGDLAKLKGFWENMSVHSLHICLRAFLNNSWAMSCCLRILRLFLILTILLCRGWAKQETRNWFILRTSWINYFRKMYAFKISP